jgi:hypothetical protein
LLIGDATAADRCGNGPGYPGVPELAACRPVPAIRWSDGAAVASSNRCRARNLPPLAAKDFVAWWRKRIDVLANEVCKCEPTIPTMDADGNVVRRNTCVVEAFDELTVDMAPLAMRLPGMLEAFDENDATKMGKEAERITTKLLDDNVPAKEQLQRAAKLRRCMEHAGVI